MTKQLSFADSLNSTEFSEAAWLEVIQHMEQAYTNLINHQVELEQKNRELEEVNQLISSVQRSMTEVLLVTDLSGKVIQINHSLQQLLNQSDISRSRQDVSQFFSLNDQKTIDLVRQHKEFNQHEVTLVYGAKQYPIVLNGTRLLDGHQQLQGMVLVGREISELRRAYKQLAESHRELQLTQEQLVNSEKMASLGRLVAGVAHELNNPISFIYGNTHALISYAKRLMPYLEKIQQSSMVEQLQDDGSVQKINKILSDLPSLLDGTLEGVERVRDIVMDLRQFSSGQQYEFKSFDLVHTINTTIRWLMKDSAVSLHCHLPDELTIEGQPGRIQQVIMNLVQNALDASEHKDTPEITITLTTQQDVAIIEIKDNGSGIPAGILPHIFEPFVTTKDSGKGTGLGLSLSYRFVADHGGTLRADNQPSGGALFTLKLPISHRKPYDSIA